MWFHSDDTYMLRRPSAGLGPDSIDLIRAVCGRDELPVPDILIDLAECDRVRTAGFTLCVTSAPGHSPGSVLFGLDAADGPIVFTGDVIFAGSVGRTDLPGGDPSVMAATLAGVVADIDDRARLLPGHGPATTMARERLTNPYLPNRHDSSPTT
jgi:glyoxylase-like metal-dependent hydrolase (beta-lactamase superfamily II)